MLVLNSQTGQSVDADAAWIAQREADALLPPPIIDYSAAIQAMLDAKAQERGYDSATSAVGYVTSGNAAWAAEAVALRDWRDAVWTYALAALADVQAGTRTAPVVSDFIAEVTAACPFEWPE